MVYLKMLLKEEIDLSAKIAKVSQTFNNSNNGNNNSLSDHSIRFDNINSNSNSINGSILGTSVKLEEMTDDYL